MNEEDKKPDFFQICITILEARHLALPNMNPLVCVQVDEERRYTAVKENTDQPSYNEVKSTIWRAEVGYCNISFFNFYLTDSY
jgi:hypothetical protein